MVVVNHSNFVSTYVAATQERQAYRPVSIHVNGKILDSVYSLKILTHLLDREYQQYKIIPTPSAAVEWKHLHIGINFLINLQITVHEEELDEGAELIHREGKTVLLFSTSIDEATIDMVLSESSVYFFTYIDFSPILRTIEKLNQLQLQIEALEDEMDEDALQEALHQTEQKLSRRLEDICDALQPSVAYVIFQLGLGLGHVKDNVDMLWFTILAQLSILESAKTSSHSISTIQQLKLLIDTLPQQQSQTKTVGGIWVSTTTTACTSTIQMVQELNLPFLNHWSLWEALIHSFELMAGLSTYKRKGVERARLILAHLGISIAISQQPFIQMTSSMKQTLMANIDTVFKILFPNLTWDVIRSGFVRRRGWMEYNAWDTVLQHRIRLAMNGSIWEVLEDDNIAPVLDYVKRIPVLISQVETQRLCKSLRGVKCVVMPGDVDKAVRKLFVKVLWDVIKWDSGRFVVCFPDVDADALEGAQEGYLCISIFKKGLKNEEHWVLKDKLGLYLESLQT